MGLFPIGAHTRLITGSLGLISPRLPPQLYLGTRICPLELLQLHRKLFLKVSRSSESAPWALDDLGSWGLMPTCLRYSQPRWLCTFSIPISCSIQRATFGPLHIPPPPGGASFRRAWRNRAWPSSSTNALSLAPGLPWRRSPSPSTPCSS